MHARQFTKPHTSRPVVKHSHHSHLAGAELVAESFFSVDFSGYGHALSYIRIFLRTKELLCRDLRNSGMPLRRCWPTTATLESQVGYSARYPSLSWQTRPSEWIEQRLQSVWSGRKNFSRRARQPMPCKNICRRWQTIPRTTMCGKWPPSFVFPCNAPVKL